MVKPKWVAVMTWQPAFLRRLPGIPLVGPLLRWLWRGALAAYLIFFILLLLLRYWILPSVPAHQAEIEQAASKAIGMPVKIERIAADWQGLNPRLTLESVRLLDKKGQPALAFSRVESVLSWRTVWRFKPILALLAIDAPVLHMRRDREGHITIAGIAAEGQGNDRQASDWFFEQRRIHIRDATIVWEDAKRQAPPLILEDLQFVIDNRGDRHRFGLSAVPPAHLASRLELRGDLRGNPMDGPEKLTGQAFAEMDYADLAGWRAWVDYPLQMQQGRGALRVWGDWKNNEASLVADMALEDVRVRLGRHVPQLDLSSMRGRLEGRYRKDDWEIAGNRVELSTLSGIRVPPSDFRVAWRQQSGDKEGRINGKATANFMDLEALQRLAEYLPLDARSRELLAKHQPRGRIADLRATWEAEAGMLKRYDLRARFEGMGLRADGVFPGGSGLSGELEANASGGNLQLQGKAASLDLPSVFPERNLPIAELRAKANWKIDGAVVDVRLEQLDFSSPDGEGTAQGSFRYDGQGPGYIDLKATLHRAEGRSVWRYMPHAVNPDARAWLKRGIVGGTASDVRLALKGDLRHFPFADKSKGEFLITGKVLNATIDYAPGWPAITGVNGNMQFGAGMQINAVGNILGAGIKTVSVGIPDFGAANIKLLVDGQLEGPTAEFLSFIEKSPVLQMLDRRTEGMQASGLGTLALKLDIPLRHAADTKVQGEYQLADNQITVAPGFPAVHQVNGKIAFTDRNIEAPDIRGQLLGAPMRVAIRNQADVVSVTMSGGAVIREMRKMADHPLLDHLSGQTTWKGEVRMQKNIATFVVDSDLVGVASSLPEPFNKSTRAALPLKIEKSALPGNVAGDRVRLVLRDVAEFHLLRRQKGSEMVVEQGAIGIGTLLPAMPAQGVVADVRLTRLDADFWRNVVVPPKPQDKASSTQMAFLPLTRVNLDATSLRLLGRDFRRVELEALKKGENWQMAVSAEEAKGELNWNTLGKGMLRANLKRLAIPSEVADSHAVQADETLPDLDVRVGDLVLGGKPLGELNVKARNEGGKWQLEHLSLSNPDGSLKGKGEWTIAGGQHTKLDFELNARDVGKLLDRMKMPGTVQRGTATLKGGLNWDGPLTSIHYQSLSGNLAVAAENGQFSKVEPGVGRLLGLISPQSLFRRISGDFRDVTHKGLAFDTIEGKLLINKGVVRTQDALKIDGPAVHVLIRGEADIKTETQDLRVTVQPEMGGLAAVGAGAATLNPIVGGAVWLGSKLLQNPLNRMFADQYRVTGSWSDPKVEKLGQIPPMRTTADYYSSPANVPEEGK